MVELIETVLADNIPFGFFAATTTDYPLQKLADCSDADKVSFSVRSTLDQAVDITVIGKRVNTPADLIEAYTIGSARTIAAGSSTTQHDGWSVSLNEEQWWPWLGLMVTTGAAAPTAGLLNVFAVVRSRVGSDVNLQLGQFLQEMRQERQEMLGLMQQIMMGRR